MAHPFEQRPTLREFLEWARSEGCEVKQGVRGVVSITRIKAPNGRFAFLAGVQNGEGLMPTQISHLHRRLGMKSPFSGAPEFD